VMEVVGHIKEVGIDEVGMITEMDTKNKKK